MNMTPRPHPISLQMLAQNIRPNLDELPTDKDAQCFYGNPLQSHDANDWIQRWPYAHSPNSWDWLASVDLDGLLDFLNKDTNEVEHWNDLSERWSLWEWLSGGSQKNQHRLGKVESLAIKVLIQPENSLIDAFFKVVRQMAQKQALNMDAIPVEHFPHLVLRDQTRLFFNSNMPNERLNLVGIKEQFYSWCSECTRSNAYSHWANVSPWASWLAVPFLRKRTVKQDRWPFDPDRKQTPTSDIRYWPKGGKKQQHLRYTTTLTSNFLQACAMENWLLALGLPEHSRPMSHSTPPITLGTAENVMTMLGLSAQTDTPNTPSVRYAKTSEDHTVGIKNVTMQWDADENHCSVHCLLTPPSWLTVDLRDAVAVLQINRYGKDGLQCQTAMLRVMEVNDPDPATNDEDDAVIELCTLKTNAGFLSSLCNAKRHSWNAKLTQCLTSHGMRAVIGVSLDMQLPD